MPDATGAEAAFRSREEAREVLDRAMAVVDSDEIAGPLLQASGLRERLRFDDLDLSLSLAAESGADCCIRWSFAKRPPFEPQLSLTMDSATGNRLLQGRESIPIAIARGRITLRGDQRAALLCLPLTKLIARHYSELVREEYPHLLVGD